MATYRPTKDVYIPEPCSESWDAMDGDARLRHCAACDSHVHNLAAMTAQQIEALLDAPGPMPCMRIARYEDGSLLVSEEMRRQPAYSAIAGVAMAALVSLSCGVAGGQTPSRTVGKIAAPATYTGRVLGPDGKPVARATVFLRRGAEASESREATTDAEGNFTLQAWPGVWQMGATGPGGMTKSLMEEVTLKGGEQKAKRPVQLQVITVTAGAPVVAPKK